MGLGAGQTRLGLIKTYDIARPAPVARTFSVSSQSRISRKSGVSLIAFFEDIWDESLCSLSLQRDSELEDDLAW